MTNPTYEIQHENGKRKLLRQLLATAERMITYEIGLSVGARKLSNLILWLQKYEIRINIPVLDRYIEQINPYPSGPERLHCSRDALRRYDKEIRRINSEFHDQIIDACFSIIERFKGQDSKAITIHHE